MTSEDDIDLKALSKILDEEFNEIRLRLGKIEEVLAIVPMQSSMRGAGSESVSSGGARVIVMETPPVDDLQPSLARMVVTIADVGGPVEIRDLAGRLNLSPSLTAAYLRRLEDRSYLLKKPNVDPSSSSRYLYLLTSKALAYLERFHET